jgi:hypothetical protein
VIGSGFITEMAKVAQVPIDTEVLGVLLAGAGATDVATKITGPRFINSIDFKDNAEKRRLNESLRAYAQERGIKILPGAQMRTSVGRILDALMDVGRVSPEQQEALHGKIKGTFYEPYGNAAFVWARNDSAAQHILDLLRKEHFPDGEAASLTPADVRKGIVFGHDMLINKAPVLLGHELGHSTQTSGMQQLGGAGAVANAVLPLSLLTLEHPARAAIPIGAASAAVAIPKLYLERQASNRGLKLLEDGGASPKELDRAQRSLNRALSTYYASLLPIPATLLAYGLVKRFIR